MFKTCMRKTENLERDYESCLKQIKIYTVFLDKKAKYKNLRYP